MLCLAAIHLSVYCGGGFLSVVGIFPVRPDTLGIRAIDFYSGVATRVVDLVFFAFGSLH